MLHLRLRRLPVLLAVAGVCAAALNPARSDVLDGVATVEPLSHRTATERYPVYDATGQVSGSAAWRVTDAGGNCCEVFVAATPDGRLVEFGGSDVAFTADQGRSWSRVVAPLPTTNGEGSLAVAPGGDVVGVGWDANADRVEVLRYTAANRTWRTATVPLHTPFHDRPWIAVVKGPFTVDGRSVPWVSLVVSGYWGSTLMSTDGLNYRPITRAGLLGGGGAAVSGFLPVRRDKDLDWLQPHSETRVVSLPGGGALSYTQELGGSCPTSSLQADGTWRCFTFGDGAQVEPRLVTDGRGWLHQVSDVGVDDGAVTSLTFRTSNDGGRTWREADLVAPPGVGPVEAFDVKVLSTRGRAVVAVHRETAEGEADLDLVHELDVSTATPRLLRTYALGLGDHPFGGNIASAAADRFDYSSVALLPDGTIAAAFGDSAHTQPALAILTR